MFFFSEAVYGNVIMWFRLPPEKRSLRAYVSILYADPRMKVYIQSRKVQTKRLLDTLYAVKRYNFASKTFRTRAERELAKAKEDVKVGRSADWFSSCLSVFLCSTIFILGVPQPSILQQCH